MKHTFKMAVAAAAFALSGCGENTYPDQKVTDAYAKMFLTEAGDNAEETLVGTPIPMKNIALRGTQLGILLVSSVNDYPDKQEKCMTYTVFKGNNFGRPPHPSNGSPPRDVCIDLEVNHP